MLQGTTKIELTDVNTGETQVVEKHNTVTGALQEIFSPVLGNLTNPNNLSDNLPAYTSFLGGLLLFDKKIEGDPLPVFAPAGTNLIGCARYNDTNLIGSAYLGNYDPNESVLSPSTRMAKLVYNFTQTQANGTINSICLTHRTGGYGVYKSDFAIKNTSTKLGTAIYNAPNPRLVRNDNDRYSGIYNYSEDEHLYAIDVDNDLAYYFRVPDANRLVLVKRRVRLTRYSMFGHGASLVGDPVEINLTSPINATSAGYNAYNFDTETNTLYIVSQVGNASYLAVGGSFTIIAVKLGESIATYKTLTNRHSTAMNIQCSCVYRGRVYSTAQPVSTTVNGYSAYKYPVISHSLSDDSVATHGNVIQSSTGMVPRSPYFADGRIYWQASYSTYKGIGGLQVTDCTATAGGENTTPCGVDVIDYSSSGSSVYYGNCTPVLNHPMIQYVSCGDDIERFVIMSHYLGTINNLATPIQKANTQTMKITYTIQEV